MRTSTYTQFQALDLQMNHLYCGYDAQQIFSLSDEAIDYHQLLSGVEMVFRTVEITNTIEEKIQHSRGFDGQIIEQITNTETVVVEEKPMILRKRKGKLVWLDQ